tara:strand:+ start:414 stop:638 length:225 start_codon:yes stop_codon:yes gene_type:complete
VTPQAKLEIVMDRLRSTTCFFEAERAKFFDQVATEEGHVESDDAAHHLAWFDHQIAENKAALNIQVRRRKVVGS